MSESVNFIQGRKEQYSPSEMQGGLFFSKDSKEILLNGESYGNATPADEEDITAEDGNLKLKDRVYDEASFSGKGYKILRKNIVEGKNILTQDMVNEPNTIYEIRYDFDLNGTTINIPEGCVLKFEGGSLDNGQLVGSQSCIIAPPVFIFKELLLISGTWTLSYAYCEWFGAAGDGVQNDSTYVSKLIDLFNVVTFCSKTYLIGNIELKDYTHISGVYQQTIIQSPATSPYNYQDDIQDEACDSVFHAKDKAFITIENLRFQLDDYYNGIWLENSDVNGAGIDFDLRPTLTNLTFEGGYCCIYIGSLTREAKLLNILSYRALGNVAINCVGTDNSLMNITVGGCGKVGVRIGQNCRGNNIKVFTAGKSYYLYDKDNLYTVDSEHSAMYIQGSYSNIVNLDLQQNYCHGLLVNGSANYIQGVFNASSGYLREQNDDTVSASVIFVSSARANYLEGVFTTGFLSSYCSHYIYNLNTITGVRASEFRKNVIIIQDNSSVGQKGYSIINNTFTSQVTVNNLEVSQITSIPEETIRRLIKSETFYKYQDFIGNIITDSETYEISLPLTRLGCSNISEISLEYIIYVQNSLLNDTMIQPFLNYQVLVQDESQSEVAIDEGIFKFGVNTINILEYLGSTYLSSLEGDLTLIIRLSKTESSQDCVVKVSYPIVNIYRATDLPGVQNPFPTSGTSELRPNLDTSDQGFGYFDTTLNKQVFWNGTSWIDPTENISWATIE